MFNVEYQESEGESSSSDSDNEINFQRELLNETKVSSCFLNVLTFLCAVTSLQKRI